MDSRNILSLLGLAKRGGKLAAGEEPVEGVCRARDARVLLLASDAADNTRRRIERFADVGQCMWLRVPFSKAELGRAVGRTSVAVLALTDVGLAAAVVRRLALLDPARYDESAARLDLKAQRAAERRAEMTAHEKNLRKGKRRPKAPPPPPETAPPEPAPPAKPAARRKPSGPRGAGASSPAPGVPRKAGPSPQTPGGPRKPGARFQRSGGPRRADDRPGRPGALRGSRPAKDKRPKPKAKTDPYAHSHPVKKGKGSFRKREG